MDVFDVTRNASLPPKHLPGIAIRRLRLQDTAAVAELARESGGLDHNSTYLYALLCTHFADTGAIAIADHGAVGFVVGYRVPSSPDTLFVWQIATAASFRGRGVATQIILWLLGREELASVRFLEATVTASNGRSERLFRSLAHRLSADCAVRSSFFPSGLFLEGGHEAEDLFRIGPFRPSSH